MTEVTVDTPLPHRDHPASDETHVDRYGRNRQPQRRLSRRATIISIAIIAVITIVIALVAFRPKTIPTTPQTISYSIVDSSSTRATVAIFPDQKRDVSCIVQATNEFEAIVGFTEVTVPASPNADPTKPTTLEVELATTQLASSGHADACWFD